MNANVKITYCDQDGNAILNPVEGDKAYSPETGKLYVYTNGEWKMIEGDVNLGMSMYDLNKQIISQLKALNEEGMLKAFETLDDFVERVEAQYFMLLCRDINYYTLFKVEREGDISGTLERFSAEVIDCVLDNGAIKSVEPVPGDAIEIWVEPAETEPVAMYLFPYDRGVIQCTL